MKNTIVVKGSDEDNFGRCCSQTKYAYTRYGTRRSHVKARHVVNTGNSPPSHDG